MKIVAYNSETREILGFYSKTRKDIPTPNMEIDIDTFNTALTNGHNIINADGTTEKVDFRTQEEIDASVLNKAILEAKKVLSDTDFYILRQIEESIDIPSDIATARANAKQLLRDNGISYTLPL
jgi:hypothetical protein